MCKVLCSLYLLLIVLCCSPASAAQTITLVADEWPPFNTKPGNEHEGYVVDIAKEIFEANNYSIVYKNVPWNRAIKMTQAGEYDGAIGASKTDAKGFIFPAEELARNKLAFYVKKGNSWRFREHSSITTVALGAIAGYDYREWLNEYIAINRHDSRKVQVITGNEPLKRNLNKLMHGWIDTVVDTEAAILYLAGQLGIADEIECAGYGEEPSYIYIAFSPNNPNSTKYAEILSKGITRMREDGSLQKTLEKYGLKDWK